LQNLFKTRQEILQTPVDWDVEEDGSYARLDEIDDRIKEHFDKIAAIRGSSINFDTKEGYKCPGKGN
jgi:hypothetical protein